MYANYTRETCTGTGDTLTLTGATSDSIPFSRNFADGDYVAYSLLDSGGVIRITGIGTYNSGANTITRNDLWNDNGTVSIDAPVSNITLSGGTHTIDCAESAQTLMPATAIPLNRTRAWVNFNGTGVIEIRESFNVSSLTDNGTGDNTIHFENALPDANYAFSINGGGPLNSESNTHSMNAYTTTASSMSIRNRAASTSLGDVEQIAIIVSR